MLSTASVAWAQEARTDAKIELGSKSEISLAYLRQALSSSGQSLRSENRLEVVGAGLKFRLDNRLSLGAGFGQSNLLFGRTNLTASDNAAYNFDLGYNATRWGFQGGVRRVEQNYIASSDWDRMGRDLSVNNVQDVQIGGWFVLTDRVQVSGEASYGEALVGSAFDFTSWSTRLQYNFSKNAFGILGYENIDFDFGAGQAARQRWATFGVGYNLDGTSMLKFMYQYGDREGRGWGGAGQPNRSHVISSQLSVKF